MDAQRRLIELGNAVADGTPVDWDAAELQAAEPAELEVVRHLRLVERIALVHASLSPAASALPPHDSLLHPASRGATPPTDAPITWGPLTILDKIGRGTFGDVYRARDPRLDRPVALKLLRQREKDPEGLETAVVEEGRLLARIRHPNVVTVYGAERIDGRTGLWMEFVDGRTLEEELRARGPFDPGEVVRIGIDLCRALNAVHRAGLLHRDLKAQNAMRDTDGRVLLTDFGAGRELTETTGGAGHELAGTPLYLAPEVLEGTPASTASDVYSLGVLLFHLATGSFPVRGRSIRDLRDAHARRARSSLCGVRPELPAALVSVIEQAIEPDPSRRYQRAADLERALETISHPTTRVRRVAMVAAMTVALAGVAALPALLWRAPAARNASGGNSQGSTPRPGILLESTVNIRRIDITNLVSHGELSADGKYLPYSDSNQDGLLKLLEVATGKARILASDPGREDVSIEYSVVSPDNSEVAYSWESGACECVELRIVDTQGAGNPPRVLVHQETPGWIAPVDWSPDKVEILVHRWTKDLKFQIAMVSALDGTVRVVKSRLDDVFWMHLSPDGRYVAYDYPVPTDKYARDISVIASDGSGDVPLVQAPSSDAHPMWTPDGRGVVFASDRSGTLGLWTVAIVGGVPQGAPEILKKDMGLVRPHSITRNGTLFYSLQSGPVDVYTARFAPDGAILPGSAAQAAGRFLGSNMDPDWSPDGRSLVYVSQRPPTGPPALIIRSLDTGDERELWPDLGAIIEPRWSPDGGSVLVRGADRRNIGGAWRLDARSGVILSALGPMLNLEWAPDGRTFFSVAGADLQRVQRTELSSGRTRDIYRDPAGARVLGLAVSPDGHWLAIKVLNVLEPTVTRFEVVSTSGGQAREVARFTERGFYDLQQWTRDGASILFTRRVENAPVVDELWSVPAEGGTPRSLNLVRDRLVDVRVSPDGERIAFRTGRPYWDLWLMDNVLFREPADRR